MIEKQLTTLLHIINTKGNVKRLIREGLTFKKITELIEDAVNKDFLIYEEEQIQLTKQGIEYLEQTMSVLNKKNKNSWIEKDEKSRIDKKEKNFIFVPRQNELTF